MKTLNDLEAAYKKMGDEIEALKSKPKEFMYVDQPVVCNNHDFGYRATKKKALRNGRNSYNGVVTQSWDEITPDLEAPSVPNWIQNTGVRPLIAGEYIKINAITLGGDCVSSSSLGSWTWAISDLMSSITCYCIIRKPEMIE